jgi:hypothetical protein
MWVNSPLGRINRNGERDTDTTRTRCIRAFTAGCFPEWLVEDSGFYVSLFMPFLPAVMVSRVFVFGFFFAPFFFSPSFFATFSFASAHVSGAAC